MDKVNMNSKIAQSPLRAPLIGSPPSATLTELRVERAEAP